MNLKRYRVNNIQEALQQIKKDLGPDAIIVSTRQVKESKFGMFGKTMLEVTAARDEKAKKQKEKPPPKPLTKNFSYGTPEPASPTHSMIPPFKSQEDPQKIIVPIRQEIQELKDLVKGMGRQPVYEQQSVKQLKQEVMEIRQMLSVMAAQPQSMQHGELHENLLALLQQMVFNGLEEKFARRLVMEAQKSISSKELQNFSYVKIFVARMLMKIIKVTKGLQKEKSKQKLISLLGPTGVGKTTTAAKIASDQMINYKRKVAFITVDTFRIGAVEQLRTYAKIINVPLNVVSTKVEMNQSINQLSDFDVILIDTGGRSQRDEAQMFELHELFEDRGLIENTLVLSTTTKDGELNEVTRKFGDIPLSSVIFTKLDESTTYGCIFNHSIRFKKPVSFLTTGQKVPEDIEAATKERLVDLLLNLSGR